MNRVLAATLMLLLALASAPNAKAAEADMEIPGLRGADTADSAADEVASGRHLQASLGDWEFCNDSYQCKNQCCSDMYSTSDGRLKCTPVGGFKPLEGCVGSSTPPPPAPVPSPPPPRPIIVIGASSSCLIDGTPCGGINESCGKCCNPSTFWPDHRFHDACGQMPCWGTDTRCLGGTTCNSCCNGSHYVWWPPAHYCN